MSYRDGVPTTEFRLDQIERRLAAVEGAIEALYQEHECESHIDGSFCAVCRLRLNLREEQKR